jgi:flavin-dependent dehydrogenase
LPPRCDCLIVGGGPAGAVLAGKLAQSGHAVVVADDGRDRRAVPEESLLPVSLRTLGQLDVLEAVAAAAVGDPLRHGAIWGSDALAFQEQGGPGWRVRRGVLDRQLRSWAVQQGAVVAAGHTVTVLPAGGTGDAVLTAADGTVRALRAAVIAIAAGRTISGALLAVQQHSERAATAAFCLVGDGAAADREHAVVEGVERGWTWGQPLADGKVSVAAFVDVDDLRAHGIDAVLAAVLGACRGPAARLRDGKLRHAVRATPVLRTAADVLLLGDAASTIDPLASQGVEKALASADAAAAALRTVLQQPALRAAAFAEQARWEAGLWLAHAAMAADYYARETRFACAPFWRRRAERPAVLAPTDGPLIVAPALRPAPALRRHGDRFVVEPGFAAASGSPGLAAFAGVPIEPLLAAFRAPQALAAGVQAAAADPRIFVLARTAVIAAAHELVRRGLLVSAAAAAATH